MALLPVSLFDWIKFSTKNVFGFSRKLMFSGQLLKNLCTLLYVCVCVCERGNNYLVMVVCYDLGGMSGGINGGCVARFARISQG